MISSVGIIGSGKMGMDMFSFLDDFSFRLTLICETEDESEKRLRAFLKQINRKIKNGLIEEKEAEKKIQYTTISSNIHDLKECDLVIECLPEILAVKQEIIHKIETVIRADSIIASNTSSIDITNIANALNISKRFLGIHFFYPVKLKNIVELNIHNSTSQKTIDSILEFLQFMNRLYLVLPEKCNFLLNKVFLDFQTLAFWYYKSFSIPFSIIDKIVKKYIFPIGVFDFFDSVGLDTMLLSIKNYTEDEKEDIYNEMIDELEIMVNNNRLGMKTGQGFYHHGSEPEIKHQGIDNVLEEKLIEIVNGLRASYINSGFKYIEQKCIAEDDLEYAVKEYMGVEKGPVTLAKEIGYDKIINELHHLQLITGSAIFTPSRLLYNKV